MHICASNVFSSLNYLVKKKCILVAGSKDDKDPVDVLGSVDSTP